MRRCVACLVLGLGCIPSGGEPRDPSDPSVRAQPRDHPVLIRPDSGGRSVCVVDGNGDPVVGASVGLVIEALGPPGSAYGWESAQMEQTKCPDAPTGIDGCAKPADCFMANRALVVAAGETFRCGLPRGKQRLRLAAGGCNLDPSWVPQMELHSRFLDVAPPFAPGTSVFVHQGPFGPMSHQERGIGYAWDLDVPEGTEVLAIADGTVIGLYAPGQGGGCEARFADVAHNIKVEHDDDTVAQYVHVDPMVKLGDRVIVGQPIAKTAINGFICTPHLHLGVYASRERMFDSPSPRSLPLRFAGIGALVEGDRVTVPDADADP